MHHSYLLDVLVLLIAAMACVPVFERLRLGPVLGYLAAGALIGPSGLKLIDDVEATRALAEFGVVFLLFTIGLELTVERVRLISGRVYALGFLQIVVTAAVLTIVARLFGLGLAAAIIIGGALALSSTAIVMPLLSKLGKMNTSVGRMAVAILLMQDLAVGPLLVLIEALAGAQSAGAADAGMGGGQLATELGLAVIQAAAAIAVIFAAGRILFRPLFRLVAATNSPELFVGMALLVALATSWGTEVAGLSLAFGGFLAGVLLAETEFRHQVAADVQPFRGLLLGLFFMTVGMSVDLRVAATEFGAVLGLAVALMLVKGVLIAGLARLFAVPGPRALRLGAFLSQGGEFAFVALGAAALAGLIPDAAAQLIIAAAVVTMAATPLVGSAVRRVVAYLETRGYYTTEGVMGVVQDFRGHVVIVGFGEIGHIVARMLKAYDIPYVILDLSAERIKEARATGEPVYFGDATQAEVLHGVGAERALAIVVTTDAGGVAEGLAVLRRHEFPDVHVLARGVGEEAVLSLRRAGLTPIGQEATDTGMKLTGAVLELWHEAGHDTPGDRTAAD